MKIHIPWPLTDEGLEAVRSDNDDGEASPDGIVFLLNAARQMRDTAVDLYAALEHMRACATCAEGPWSDCFEGRAALAALAKARGET